MNSEELWASRELRSAQAWGFSHTGSLSHVLHHSDFTWACNCDSSFWLLSFWVTLPPALSSNSMAFSMSPVQILPKEDWLSSLLLCEAIHCRLVYELAIVKSEALHGQISYDRCCWDLCTIAGDAISRGTTGGMFLLEGSFNLIERVCASRTETKKWRKEKMVVAFYVVDSSF